MDRFTFEKAASIRQEIEMLTDMKTVFKDDVLSLKELVDYVKSKDIDLFNSATSHFKDFVIGSCTKKIMELEKEFSEL